MGRPPCCDKSHVKEGLWTPEEDAKILAYVSNNGIGNWTLVPKKAGLNRCGKSCRLRWTNYLRPDLKHDNFTPQEEETIINLHRLIGSRWSLIANHLPGRTDNDVKNYWNTKLKKKLTKIGIDPVTHKPMSQVISDYGNLSTGLPVSGNSVGSFPKNLQNNTMIMSRYDQPLSQIPENYAENSVSGFPLRRKFMVWVLMFAMWITITSIAVAYSVAMWTLQPDTEMLSTQVSYMVVFAWLILLAIVFLVQTARFFIMVCKKLRKCCLSRRTSTRTRTGQVTV